MARRALVIAVLGVLGSCQRSPAATTTPSTRADLGGFEAPSGEARIVGPAEGLEALTELLTGDHRDAERARRIEVASNDGSTIHVAVLAGAMEFIRTPQRLAIETADGWIALATLGYDMEDRTASSYARVTSVEAGTFEREGRADRYVLVRVERGTSVTRGCDSPDETAEATYFLCALDPNPICFAELYAESLTYEADNRLPSPAEALGECDDYVSSAERIPASDASVEESPVEAAIDGHDSIVVTSADATHRLAVSRLYLALHRSR